MSADSDDSFHQDSQPESTPSFSESTGFSGNTDDTNQAFADIVASLGMTPQDFETPGQDALHLSDPVPAEDVIRGVKRSFLRFAMDGSIMFSGLRDPALVFSRFDEAKCWSVPTCGEAGPASIDCSCGFYAVPDVVSLKKRLGPWNPTTVLLHVELQGNIVDHEAGWRASHQRVESVSLPPFCARCHAKGKRSPCEGAALSSWDGALTPVCADCAKKLSHHPRWETMNHPDKTAALQKLQNLPRGLLTPAELSERMSVPVNIASPDLAPSPSRIANRHVRLLILTLFPLFIIVVPLVIGNFFAYVPPSSSSLANDQANKAGQVLLDSLHRYADLDKQPPTRSVVIRDVWPESPASYSSRLYALRSDNRYTEVTRTTPILAPTTDPAVSSTPPGTDVSTPPLAMDESTHRLWLVPQPSYSSSVHGDPVCLDLDAMAIASDCPSLDVTPPPPSTAFGPLGEPIS